MAGLKLFGIPIKFSFTAWLLVGLIGFYGFTTLRNLDVTSTPSLVAGTLIIVLGFILSIVAHELTHALVARRYKMKTESITIWGLGGVAQIEGLYRKPGQMFWTSVSGPISSLVIGLVLGALTFHLAGLNTPDWLYYPIFYLAFTNLVLAVFNMVPALPLDGGRALHAIIWKINGNVHRSGIIASYLGQGFALAGVFFGWVYLRDFLLVAISAYIFLIAGAERRVHREALLQDTLQKEATKDDEDKK